MTGGELAALAAALQIIEDAATPESGTRTVAASRWKLAARRPELELEDLRAL